MFCIEAYQIASGVILALIRRRGENFGQFVMPKSGAALDDIRECSGQRFRPLDTSDRRPSYGDQGWMVVFMIAG